MQNLIQETSLLMAFILILRVWRVGKTETVTSQLEQTSFFAKAWFNKI